jgi:hypothetical protein
VINSLPTAVCEICPHLPGPDFAAKHIIGYVYFVWPDGREARREVAVCGHCVDPVAACWLSIDPTLTVRPWVAVEHDQFADTLIDPDSLDHARKAFPGVTFAAVDWVELDPCCGCPEGLMDPLPAQVIVSYRIGTREFSEPVGGCCLNQELTWHSYGNARDMTVKVLREPVSVHEIAEAA